MKPALGGIHHITALASDPQRNIDFYAGFLGLRLVKKTVNFDAPDVYHFYYGNETGRPGTLLTFFPFPDAAKGKRGVGEIAAVAFSVPAGSMDYWVDRLAGHAIDFDGPLQRFGEPVVSFEDPDGMVIELVGDAAAERLPGGKDASVGVAHVPRSLHGATFVESHDKIAGEFLSQTLGLRPVGREGNRSRYLIGDGPAAAKIDLLSRPDGNPARQSAGSVHHIAWRVATAEGQLAWRETLVQGGTSVTSVQDRMYFRSIYFREPGGILFEIATDGPGMLIDESQEELGSHLKLPPWLEAGRARLEERLIPVRLPR